MKKTLVTGTPVAVLAGLLLGADAADDPGWLSGCWQNDDGTDVEAWAQEADGSMIGFAVALAGGKVVFHELLSIRRTDAGPLRYTAYPAGQSRTAFDAAEAEAGMLRFVNPAHDYPQAIEYRRHGDRLVATISMLNGENPGRFERRRCD